MSVSREQKLINEIKNIIKGREKDLQEVITLQEEKIEALQKSIDKLHKKMDKTWWDKVKSWFK
ncbi:MAG: hypothetical protein ACOCRX_10190 [Candidatus Woesearchaeota archaeon]